ncbi:MAG: ParB/RepB/Spo0J family partition protein, partial [Pontixanthobacter sp.]
MTASSNDMAVKPTALPKRKLGRGLGALMGEIRKEEPVSTSGDAGDKEGNQGDANDQGRQTGLHALSIADIEPLPDQPRTRFDEGALDELAASIAARGVIQPIIVTPRENGKYRLVAGERRWRAA